MASSAAEFRVRESSVQDARIFDFGIRAEGGLDAGQALAEICMAGLGWASILPGDIGGLSWPHVFVTTDHPTAACLFSQYAGWQIKTEGFFAMGSGPMRAVYAREELFAKLDYREEPSEVVGVLEGRKLPNAAVVQYLCERTGVTSDKLCLLIAPTASQAGNVQVVARSVETALHKLLELGFDVRQIQSAAGAPPAAGCRGRHGGNWPHERRHSLRLAGHSMGSGAGFVVDRNRPFRSRLFVARVRKAVFRDI